MITRNQINLLQAQYASRLALQEVTQLLHAASSRQQAQLEKVQTDLHRSFVALSQALERETEVETKAD